MSDSQTENEKALTRSRIDHYKIWLTDLDLRTFRRLN